MRIAPVLLVIAVGLSSCQNAGYKLPRVSNCPVYDLDAKNAVMNKEYNRVSRALSVKLANPEIGKLDDRSRNQARQLKRSMSTFAGQLQSRYGQAMNSCLALDECMRTNHPFYGKFKDGESISSGIIRKNTPACSEAQREMNVTRARFNDLKAELATLEIAVNDFTPVEARDIIGPDYNEPVEPQEHEKRKHKGPAFQKRPSCEEIGGVFYECSETAVPKRKKHSDKKSSADTGSTSKPE